MAEPLIRIEDLCVDFPVDKKHVLHAVNHVSLSIDKGETVGLVGESGCGKTTLGRAVKGIYPATSGRIFYKGKNLTEMTQQEKFDYTREGQMIFQDPYSSLDPRMTVREIIKEGMKAHKMGTAQEMNQKVYEMLETVGLSAEHANRFPHEFSGGQRPVSYTHLTLPTKRIV